MAEPIDMPFWVKTRGKPKELLDEGADPPVGRGSLQWLSRAIQIRSNHCSAATATFTA